MAKYAALTVRKLKPGSYEEWRAAWEGDPENWPKGIQAYILRNLNDPDEIIAFGLTDPRCTPTLHGGGGEWAMDQPGDSVVRRRCCGCGLTAPRRRKPRFFAGCRLLRGIKDAQWFR